MDTILINQIKAAGKAAGQLFFEEFGEAIRLDATDWDATAWETDRESLGLEEDHNEKAYEIYSEALEAETERLAEHEILSDEEVFQHLVEIADTGSYKIEGDSLYIRREENSDWLFCGEIVNREQVQQQFDSIVATL